MRSIRSRLLAFIVPATAVALGLAAIGIDRAMTADLERARDRQLLLLAQGIGSTIELEIDGAVEFELEDGEAPELEASAGEGSWAVADGSGETLFFSGPLPDDLFARAGGEPFCRSAESAEGLMRFCVISIVREPEADAEDVAEWTAEHPGEELPEVPPRRLLVAAGLTDDSLQETLAAVRGSLFFGFGILAVVMAVIPFWAAGMSLQPLLMLSRQADAVGADNPSARLEPLGADLEVRSLVHALNGALNRLAEAYEQQKRFTADAAHELRSPLSAIRAQCEVNLRKERSREELKEVLETVHRTTLRLCEVVESLLSLSRLQNGSTMRERKNVDLAALGREALSLLGPFAESRKIALSGTVDGEVPVVGDRRLLLECQTNILDNAIRYTPAGGTVKLSVGGGEHGAGDSGETPGQDLREVLPHRPLTLTERERFGARPAHITGRRPPPWCRTHPHG